MHPPSVSAFVFATGCAVAAVRGQGHDLVLPRVVVVADGGRGTALDAILRDADLRRRRIACKDCTPAVLRLADVVVVDWPPDDLPGARPLGELERWDRPTVFFGTSGERFARSWGLPGPAEMDRLAECDRGPEMQCFAAPVGAETAVWRQGHLLHFACAAAPADLTAAERAWLVATVRRAATFVTDRPIVRHATTGDAPLPERELQRRRRIAATAALVHCDVHRLPGLLSLRRALFGAHKAQVTVLLDDLLTQCVAADEPHREWLHWLEPHRGALVWDELSYVWRLDPLPASRGAWSQSLRGDVRADGGVRDAAAAALARKVVQCYGGRAFEDLATFSCWQGDTCHLWDRRRGFFRSEDHGEVPVGARAGQWGVAVLDTAADRDVILGGGPAPQLLVSARDNFRLLVTRLFLPMMLLEPGTELGRRPEYDSAGRQAVDVRLAHRSLGQNRFLLMVNPETGQIESLRHYGGREWHGEWLLEATLPCGPLSLPTAWRLDSPRQTGYAIEVPTWNPELPPGLEAATGLLTRPRAR